MPLHRIAIVGAGLAGLRAAEALRSSLLAQGPRFAALTRP